MVVGQRLMQTASDIFLGWQRVMDIDGQPARLLHPTTPRLEGLGPRGHPAGAGAAPTPGCAGPRWPGPMPGRATGSPSPPTWEGRGLRPGRRRLLVRLRRSERAGLRGVGPGRQDREDHRRDRAVAGHDRPWRVTTAAPRGRWSQVGGGVRPGRHRIGADRNLGPRSRRSSMVTELSRASTQTRTPARLADPAPEPRVPRSADPARRRRRGRGPGTFPHAHRRHRRPGPIRVLGRHRHRARRTRSASCASAPSTPCGGSCGPRASWAWPGPSSPAT